LPTDRGPLRAVRGRRRSGVGAAGWLVIPASYRLGRALIEHDLVDEIRLVVFPVALGAGERFFGEMDQRKPMRLVDTWTIGDGLVMLSYQFTKGA